MRAALAILGVLLATQCAASVATDIAYHEDLAGSEADGAASRGLLQTSTLKPLSKICKQFRYKRYFRVSSLKEFEKYGQIAVAGDMIELMPGHYIVKGSDGKVNAANPGQGYGIAADENNGKGPSMAPKGHITGIKGTATDPIVFCGSPTKTIIDGADSVQYAQAAIRVVRASNIRIAGFTMQNVLKGLDVQGTTNSEISWITTRQTLQEGIRVRYNSQYNVVKRCTITYSGLLYAGVGEGVYIGTGRGNSVGYGLPQDKSDYNVIRNNKFGPGMQAEGVDVKEYTSHGQILENIFDGRDIAGENGGISWVAIKGNSWTIANNTGRNLPANMVGFKVVVIEPGLGEDNVINANTCQGLGPSNLCIYVDPEAQGNEIGCANTATTPAKSLARTELMCNCRFLCGRRSAVPRATPAYALPTLSVEEREVQRYDW